MPILPRQLLLPAVWRRRLLLGLAVFLGIGLLSAINAWRRQTAFIKVQRQELMPLAMDAAHRHGVDPCLVMGVIQTESGWKRDVTGKAGEVGLMQITEGAAKDWARVTDRSYGTKAHLYTPALNMEIGTWYLARALTRWEDRDDRVILSLVQYNAGPSRAGDLAETHKKEIAVHQVPIASTRSYITKVTHYRDEFRKAGLCSPTRLTTSQKNPATPPTPGTSPPTP